MNKGIEVVVISLDTAMIEACLAIYLLHDYGDNACTWVNIKPGPPGTAGERGIFFACLDGKSTWYWGSSLNADVRCETLIPDELAKYMSSHYKTVADRKGCAATGLSMGGHDAAWNGLRHSDVPPVAGGTSGGADIRSFPKNWETSV